MTMTADDHGIACLLMRGGSSKGAFFLAADLPADSAKRADLLLRVMGSPDGRQVDGIGGGHPLTSKVAVVGPSIDANADVDYLFLQVVPDQAVVSDAQTCGNLLAGVGPFAVERGLVAAGSDITTVRIRMLNPNLAYATAVVCTPDGRVRYDGDTVMAGAPFPAAPVGLTFPGRAAPVFPTGRLVDRLGGLDATCVDAGMPVVIVRASDLRLDGTETPEHLDGEEDVRARVEGLRLAAGRVMGLGDVTASTVPKVTIASPPRHGGTIMTRTFIPHRVHTAIGVLGAVSVGAAASVAGTVAADLTSAGPDGTLRIEHPTGTFPLVVELDGAGPDSRIRSSTVVRTARKLFDGRVWPRTGKVLP